MYAYYSAILYTDQAHSNHDLEHDRRVHETYIAVSGINTQKP